MGSDHTEDEEAIFYGALQLTSPTARATYVKEACGNDKDLLERVRALLAADRIDDGFLEASPAILGVPTGSPILIETPGAVVGRYKLLEKIGEGGMAVVYMAEQQEPIRRKVALKIIKLGMDTRQVIARFEAERRALGMMDHPNIARVFDAGATEAGRPYFVMELVTGVSITEYCDKNNLSTNDRLTLFVQVCHAVQHAHQKGIIHRDIKPSNVMVAHHDGRPVPKVIDFGIAKATNQKLTEKTLFTRYAHIIGTPAYMSPEQAELSDLAIDSRSDIYSLGVLLYELLTGTTPFSEEQLRKAGYLEMQRIIREEEPSKPSTKLSTLGETLADIAKHRGATPDLLARTIRGDLDWIVMKTLEKDRVRRYEGASSLALDIERYLQHRPVTAHAPSATYHLRKFLRRNRLQVGAVLTVAIVVGTIVVSFLRNQYQVELAEAQGAKQVNDLAKARKLVESGSLAGARENLLPLLESPHVGLEARILFRQIMGHDSDEDSRIQAVMNKHCRERVQYFSTKIQADPTDPNNYLQRAQQYQYLRDEEKVHADMSRYATLLGQGWFSRLRFGTPMILKPTATARSRYRVVFSVERRDNGIIITFIAFGQKGRSTMKPFEIPMFATSLLALCLFPGFNGPPVHAGFDFGTPTSLRPPIPALDSGFNVIECFSYDGLEMYISSDRPGGNGDIDLYVLKRDSLDDNWGPAENLGANVNSWFEDSFSSISSDGLTLYFSSNRQEGSGWYDVYMTTRATRNAPWGPVVNLGPTVNSSATDGEAWISAQGLELYFESRRPGGHGNHDIYVMKRATEHDPWGEPENLGPVVNSAYREQFLSLSPDGLLLLFSDHPSGTPRPGGYGNPDMWMTRRASLAESWGPPVNLGPQVNGPATEVVPRISPDGSTLYFTMKSLDDTWDCWQAPILPIVDFNGDGKVNGKDVVVLTQHWGESNSVCDIGPYAWGDGVVDEQDLFVLAEYLEDDVNDPTLIAHWALDETEGAVAYDCVGDCDAMIMGDAAWQSDGGVFGGALALDGIDDCIVTNPIPGLSEGAFSILVWVKAGAADEVILSGGTADWLYTNPADGSLMTALSSVAGNGVRLFSNVVITDGRWHRIGLVWDGASRILLVDEQEVARDEQAELAIPDAGLIIGAGATPGRFFSGQIDDLRIYRRIVKP